MTRETLQLQKKTLEIFLPIKKYISFFFAEKHLSFKKNWKNISAPLMPLINHTIKLITQSFQGN